MIPREGWGWEGPAFSYTSWRIYLALCTLPSLTSAALFCTMPESPKFLMQVTRIPQQWGDIVRGEAGGGRGEGGRGIYLTLCTLPSLTSAALFCVMPESPKFLMQMTRIPQQRGDIVRCEVGGREGWEEDLPGAVHPAQPHVRRALLHDARESQVPHAGDTHPTAVEC